MIVPVTSAPAVIDWDPATERDEVIQNVRMILRTVKGTCPLARAFGSSGDAVDLPMRAAESLYMREIVDAIRRYEPRAEIVRVIFDETDGRTGVLRTRVDVRIS